MARKKLSDAQRVAVRKEIAKRLGAGESRSSVGRLLARKYGVSTVTIRWYIKSLRGAAAPRNGSGSPIRLLDLVKHVSEDGLNRALAAKKLFLELQAKLRESERLRRAENELRKSRESLLASARRLEEKLQRLTAR
jgi:hypothetical protein